MGIKASLYNLEVVIDDEACGLIDDACALFSALCYEASGMRATKLC